MTQFKFIEDIHSYKPDNALIAVLPSNIKNQEELFNELNEQLSFPDYFGFNWDAVHDCLNDFHWIKNKGVVLIHTDIPDVKKDTLKIYFEILDEAVQNWRDSDEHYLEIVFPISSEATLKLLGN